MSASRSLSQRQKLMWFDEKLANGSPVHRVNLFATLTGPLDVPKLQAAFQEATQAYDALGLAIDPQELTQKFLPTESELPVIDVKDLADAQAYCSKACQESWPSEGRTRHRASLLRWSPTDHMLYFSVSHLLTDGASIFAFLERLEACYLGKSLAPPSTYAAFLEEEEKYLASPKATADAEYWTNLLASPPPAVRIYGRPIPPVGMGLKRELASGAPTLAANLAALSQTPPFRSISPSLSRLITLGTALVTYLYRASGQRELLLGIPMANRPQRFADSFGLMMSQLFLRVRIDEDETFEKLAAKVRQGIHEGARHLRYAVRERDLSYVTLNLLGSPPKTFAGLPLHFAVETSVSIPGVVFPEAITLPSPIGLQCCDFPQDPLAFAFDFHADAFDGPTRRQAIQHFYRVVAALVANPAAALDEVDLLDEEERLRILAIARGPEPEAGPGDPLARLAKHAREKSDAIAVEAPEGVFTYAEVDRLSSVLACRLTALGVHEDSRVCIALPRGMRELCALLAAQKAGGCYVPVDLSHPLDRIALILEDSAPDALVTFTGSPLVTKVPTKTRVVVLDDLAALSGDPPSLLPASMPDQLAYILFTSGSTGRPKGVEISRGAFANFLQSMERCPGLKGQDRVLAITTTTFDIAGLELFLPLWVGGTVVIADRETTLDMHKLAAHLARDRITLLQATPATFRLLLESGWIPQKPLRLLCGGEALPPELASRLVSQEAELWNMYGPTETTVWSTLERIAPQAGPITIGRPIDHTQIYILDGKRRLVPPGVAGELCIGGRGLARGYHHRPDLTAEKFIVDPFGRPQDRLYATGDMARLHEDGRFECLGRADHQVKIRGFRIELGEIESALRELSDVREVVVTANHRQGQDPMLVAYWVGPASQEALVEKARTKVPPYMVPSAYIHLDVFPLNTNGKIDRKQLPPPTESTRLSMAGRAPQSDDELRIALIIADVLHLSDVPVDRDFFSLGGTSVEALELRRRIEQAFGVSLPLSALFDDPTAVHLLAQLGDRGDDKTPVALPLRRGSDQMPPLFCLMGVQIYRDLALAFATDRTVYGVHIPTAPEVSNGFPSILDFAHQYAEFLLQQFPRDDYDLAGLCMGGIIAAEAARVLQNKGKHINGVALLDATLPRGKTYRTVKRARALFQEFRQAPLSTSRTWGMKTKQWLTKKLENHGLGQGLLKSPTPESTLLDPQVLFDPENTFAQDLLAQYDKQVSAFSFPLTVFRAENREDNPWYRASADLGWSALTHDLRVVNVPGTHLAILKAPSVFLIAEEIGRTLKNSSAP